MRLQVLLVCLVYCSCAVRAGNEEQQQKTDKCTLPPEPGNCRARKRRVFFNAETKRCELFYYTGCNGNGNQFTSLLECHESCQHQLPPDSKSLEFPLAPHVKSQHCLLPPIELKARKCRASFQRFTFNARSGNCESYSYGGCGASQNLYSTAEECVSACVHGPTEPAVAPAVQKVSVRGGRPRPPPPQQQHQEDTTIVFPGFADEEDVCQLPPITPGLFSCLAFMEKWTYDAHQGDCVKYVYGGCRGTANLFETRDACEERCKRKPKAVAKPTPERCLQPPMHPSPIACAAFIPKFTYNAEKLRCEPFLYGGCFGTENLFDTETECIEVCDPGNAPEPKTVDACGLPIDVGPCRGAKPKYAFNSDTRRCELFLYGGCQGNDNRFSSVQECVDTCGGLEPSENPLCTFVTCNEQEASLYLAKACEPVIKAGECCPSSWDCTTWEERLQRKDQCFIANKDFPQGKYYSPGDPMPEVSKSCSVGCFCRAGNGLAKPVCASVDCPRPTPPQEARGDCRTLYSDVNSCCPTETRCGDIDLAGLHNCKFENKTYVAGQKMYSQEDVCRVCYCAEGWDGDKRMDKFCHTVDCFLHRSDKLAKGCQPVYKEGVCCPTDWICPGVATAAAVTERPAKAAVGCPEGSSVVEDVADRDIFPEIEPLSVTEGYENDVRPDASDVCLLPKPRGPCTGFEEMWYFDMAKRTCKSFMYGGFEEDAENVFYSEEMCKHICSKYLLEEDSINRSRCQDTSEEASQPPPPKTDSCRARNVFKYNRTSKKCESHVSLFCGANDNSFTSLDECEAVCTKVNKEGSFPGKDAGGSCNMPVQQGNCRSRLRRFYYDSSSGLCRQFWYSGCQGNRNNFEDERSCLQKCVDAERLPRAVQGSSLEVRSPCNQTKETGPCRGAKPKWHYDRDSETCRLFLYGGCEGNLNRFDTLQECTSTCPINWPAQRKIRRACQQPLVAGDCRDSTEPRYYFNEATDKCEMFMFGGCDGEGNENNFITKTDCMLSCKLSQKRIAGGKKQNPASSQAVTAEENDIEAEEVEPSVTDETTGEERLPVKGLTPDILKEFNDPCMLDKVVGNCRASFRRYHFNRETKKCNEFFYGGCMGNNNNFATMQQCKQVCQRHLLPDEQVKVAQMPPSSLLVMDPACSEPMDAGPCKAVKPMWFFNSTSDRCERFFWGGCKGNLNRFHTKEDCQSSCPSTVTPPSRSGSSRSSSVHLPPAPPKCHQGSKSFNLGDMIRFNEDKCRKCTCNAPPGLTCIKKSCKPLPPMPKLESAICEETFDDDGCCPTGYQCVSANPPQTQNSGGETCETKSCPEITSLPKSGAVNCVEEKDEDGCCITAVTCLSVDPPSLTLKKPCKPLPPTPKGAVCRETFDETGCATGYACVSANPPHLQQSCEAKSCPKVPKPPKAGAMRCVEEKDEDGCCVIAVKCVSADPPSVNGGGSNSVCARRSCPDLGLLQPPGKNCIEKWDEDGCCVIRIECV